MDKRLVPTIGWINWEGEIKISAHYQIGEWEFLETASNITFACIRLAERIQLEMDRGHIEKFTFEIISPFMTHSNYADSPEPIVKKILNTSKKVLEYLKLDSKYRDNDEVLVARYWYDELVEQKLAPGVMTGTGFLKAYAEGRLTSADVITRARRKAQEADIELRGLTWNERHGMAEDVRQHINDNQFLKNQ